MMRRALLALVAFTIVAGLVYAGVVIFSGNLAEVTFTVKPASFGVESIAVALGTFNSLQRFDSGWFDPAGYELTIQNISEPIPVAVVYVDNLSDAEKAALQSLLVDVWIYNESGEVLNGTIDALNDTALDACNLLGSYNVAVRVRGKTALASALTPVAFNVTIDLDPEVAYAHAGSPQRLSFDVTDVLSGVGSVAVTVDGKPVPLTVSGGKNQRVVECIVTLDPGVHSVRIFAADNADNVARKIMFVKAR